VSGRAPSRLKPIDPPRSLAEDAADRIREEILGGGFQQGEHLVEAAIATQLNTSRGPVREAFKLLRAEGLLVEEPRRGTFVVRLDADDVREVYGLRGALESAAARSLARAHDAQTIAELRSLATVIDEAASDGDARATAQADLAFHERLCELSGNGRIHEVFTRYIPTLRALLRLDEQVIRSLADIAEQHRPLVEAIEAGDEQLAGRMFADHAEQAGGLIADFLAASSDIVNR
jgi:DNA-binding GntR family transcriptional regulator